MSNNNATVALPGHDNWGVWWSPQSGFEDFQLDIVGFLAVLGESSVTANAQVAALSRIFYLPRLLPAPQALLRTSRPTTLASTNAKVTGVYSGNVKDHVHHVANVLLGEPKESYTVQHVTISKKTPDPNEVKTSYGDILFRGTPRRARNSTDATQLPPPVKGKAAGPLFWVTLIGFLEVVILFTCSIIFGDGMSLLATILLGGLSTVVGVCNKWTLELSKLPDKAASTGAGDAVIRYPNGSYKIVKCTEEVARELFFAPEEIDYNIKSEATYRLLSLMGTVMLMLGVIALANAKLQLQFGWAGAFIIINIAHWVAAALPQESHWDLSCYDCDIITYPKEDTDQSSEKQKNLMKRILNKILGEQPERKPKSNFTLALWKAILLTRSIKWVPLKEAAPATPVWDKWLLLAKEQADILWEEAEQEAKSEENSPATPFELPDFEGWDAKDAWNKLYREDNPESQSTTTAAPAPASARQVV